MVEESIRDPSDQFAQIRNRRAKHAGGQLRRREIDAGFPQNHAGAARSRIGRKLQSMSCDARQRKEQTAGANRPAVERHIVHMRVIGHDRRNALEQPGERRTHGLVCTSETAAALSKSSGATFIKRSEPDITLANTGAATVPPCANRPISCVSRLGSSITTTVASFGCDAGTRPANTAMILSVE